MFFRMIGSLLPTQKNREAYKRDQQLFYLIENDPDFAQSAKESTISKQEMDDLYKRLDEATAPSRKSSLKEFLYRIHDSLYQKITKNWDKGLDALTPQRRAELLRDCEIVSAKPQASD